MSFRPILCSSLMWLSACAPWNGEAHARDAAKELLHCDQVELEAVGEAAYRARGCNRQTSLACSTADNEPRCIAVRFRGEPSVQSTPIARPLEPTSSEPSQGGGSSEDEVRQHVDRLREEILACVSRDRVLVRLEPGADRTPRVSLLDPVLVGSPEEGCVRALLISSLEVQLSAPVLHWVHR